MNNTGGSKTDTIVKLSLVFFISLFSFSVGTFVGKQVSDSDRRRIALESEYDETRSVASVDKTEKAHISEDQVQSLSDEFVKAEEKLSDKNISKPEAHREVASAKEPEVTDDGFVKIDRKKEKAEKLKAGTKSAGKTNKADKKQKADTKPAQSSYKAEPAPKAIQRVANGQSPAPNYKPPRKPASILPTLSPRSIGKYTVQIASYSAEKEAKSHAAKLKNEGYSAFYVSAKVKGHLWYRVSVGLFDSRKSANNFKSELKKQAGVKSAIVQKIIK